MAMENMTVSPTQGQGSYNPMNQVSSGPAAILYALANELIKIQNELQDLYNQVAIIQTMVQKSTIESGAESQRNAALRQSWATVCQAIEAFTAGATTLGTTIAAAKGNTDIKSDMEKLEPKMKPLQALESVGPKPTAPNLGPNPAAAQQGQPPRSADVDARIARLKAGDYEGLTPAEKDKATAQGMTEAEYLMKKNTAAINKMSETEYLDFKKTLNEKLGRLEEAMRALQTRLTNEQATYTQWGQIAKGLIFDPIAKGAESTQMAAAGEAQAAQQVSSGLLQMANGTAESARSSLIQAYAKISEILNAARQGVQGSYANG